MILDRGDEDMWNIENEIVWSVVWECKVMMWVVG